MHSLPQEFLALCRHLGDVQKRCSATVAAQAAQIEALQAQVLRLRAEVIVRDTRLAMAQDALAQWKAAHPSLPRRKAMARHISVLVERIASLSRECLRWRLAAEAPAQPVQPERSLDVAGHPSAGKGSAEPDAAPDGTLDASLAAADLVICQTGCISHNAYWKVKDFCKRTGKRCVFVENPSTSSLVRGLEQITEQNTAVQR